MSRAANQPRPCPACGALRARDAFVVNGHPHRRCRECGTLFVDPVPAQDSLDAIYTHPDYHEHANYQDVAPRRAEARGRAARLHAMGAKDVLEVGCGIGFFLDAARELGMRAEGVDRAPTAAKARSRGHTVHDCWLAELEPVEPRFDVVAAWDVIEHVPDPLEMIADFRARLRPGGVLALATPSLSGVLARVLGPRFPMICPPDHLEVFTRRGLTTLLERGGFELTELLSFSSLGRAQLRRGFMRYALGSSRPASAVAGALAWVAEKPARLIDRVGLGISFEAYARAK